MKTEILSLSDADLRKAAELIKSGALVAIPTETVYGLGANGLDPGAVARIYDAKGRPQDNPLILHLGGADELELYCREIPTAAMELAAAFWPGPLTMVLKRHCIVPDITTAGLDSVAVRCPAGNAARTIIRYAGVPIAAPSANISGRPSPTKARHVLEDLSGKIEAVVDGGDCTVGVESTIIDMTSSLPRLLRLGGLPLESIEAVVGHVELPEESEPERPLAPGMKYRHYAPNARLILIEGGADRAAEFINSRSDKGTAVLCPVEEEGFYAPKRVVYGALKDPQTMARGLFAALRELDELGVNEAYARCPGSGGILDAVRNRLIKAAAYVIDVEAEE